MPGIVYEIYEQIINGIINEHLGEIDQEVPVINGGTRKYNNLQLVHGYKLHLTKG